jgi:predicted CDP-diglyceride synthetase/phosphatidate cytidylyltransferase
MTLNCVAPVDIKQKASLLLMSFILTLTSFSMYLSWKNMSEWMRPIMSISLLKAANVWRFANPEFLSTAFAH